MFASCNCVRLAFPPFFSDLIEMFETPVDNTPVVKITRFKKIGLFVFFINIHTKTSEA